MIENIFEKRVAGIEPFSMLDFGENLCGILFYNGCTFKCPYCYNKSLAQWTAKTLPAEEVITFLNERRGKLDGIVFSGGGVIDSSMTFIMLVNLVIKLK